MELQFFGANCIKLTAKKASVVIDDNLASLGLKPILKAGDIQLITSPSLEHAKADTKIKIDQPGEYEVSDISIQGIAARSHMDEEGQKSAVIYKIIYDDIKLVVAGHIYPSLSSAQLEQLGAVDVLVIPVGGNGYTTDPIGALKVVKAIEPKLVIPTHYEDKDVKYEVPQQPLEEALKTLAMEAKEPLSKLKLKAADLGEVSQIVILERQ